MLSSCALSEGVPGVRFFFTSSDNVICDEFDPTVRTKSRAGPRLDDHPAEMDPAALARHPAHGTEV